ncbi:hypothetical protein [Hyphomicrobium sp.]|uniref:hypothetical protein n=1 Tax=Hyphomicrobium sp. TaxID=82 RepID=UPI002E376071|nr:hypothetical protein [Hyphomicrobium sp.]HEX2842723.1 hypothetical protein [Hyphomicrobium sp.]
MTTSPPPRARAAERSLWRIFAAPILIALVSLVGLISALVADGPMDVLAWVGLGVPVAVCAWFVMFGKVT